MKGLAHYRAASKAAGDDITLTRYVRVGWGEAKRPERGRQPRLTDETTAPGYVVEGRTKFPTRVMSVDEMPSLLVSGHSNVKIGRDVRKGHLKGYWIYTLSLEERATCPTSCKHWQSCYGNNMPFAKRVNHRDEKFLASLEAEIAKLLRTRGRRGTLIRLHALGDFYSPAYVDFWRDQLRRHPALAVFGYTAHPWHSTIGQRLQLALDEFGDRAMIRNSDGDRGQMATVSIASEEACPPDAFVCPEQTGQTRCCATCGACWSTKKNVAFVAH